MRQSTLLISRFLIAKYPSLAELTGADLRDCLHRLLKDPLLWKKMDFLQSGKYKKQYQEKGQMLKRVYFYPFPEDWCLLSILSNGSGYSRCYIFIYLLEYELGERSIENDGTPSEKSNFREPTQFFCAVGVDFEERIFQRKLKNLPEHPQTPFYDVIYI